MPEEAPDTVKVYNSIAESKAANTGKMARIVLAVVLLLIVCPGILEVESVDSKVLDLNEQYRESSATLMNFYIKDVVSRKRLDPIHGWRMVIGSAVIALNREILAVSIFEKTVKYSEYRTKIARLKSELAQIQSELEKVKRESETE